MLTQRGMDQPRSLTMSRDDRRNAPHVLLAEDDAAMRELLSFCLYQAGYRVTSCADGLSLLECLEGNQGTTNSIDLLVTDIRMPALTGLEALEANGDSPRKLPTICMTAFGDSRTHAAARQLGAVEVLDKPFDIDQFLDRVRNLCPLSGNA
ncbi:hypothetical protein C2E25_00740 [Geothermobacter hydrogeniphilus]|uniref:Response regulatory domain-containing protein n=2 Tax=Geothermobacter hydrogeniphilus TaxID=1969733 RepID=A0A2K2HEU6_9BACT|nr:hypothetical protein C2E25_00740 [Geothermobacter hydrogeniphilus]